jgi:hypothetical protein
MTSTWLRWAWRIAGISTATVVLAAGACGGDDSGTGGSGTGTGTGTGTASGTETGTGGSTTGTPTGGEGAGSPFNCDDNNRCELGNDPEDCVCNDCWVKSQCNEAANCVNDGMCSQEEGCFCEDCSATPECQGYCLSCEEYVTYYSTTQFFCAGSEALFQGLDNCACGGPCAADCGGNHCLGNTPDQACLTCMEETCTAPYDACLGDKVERNYCNPVSGEGCTAVLNARCDWIRNANPKLQDNGFQCFLGVDEQVCSACDYTNASAGKCEKNSTCVDAAGQFADQGNCAKYCCNDADCGTGSCVKGQFTGDVGVCFDGAGGGAGIECMPPTEAPSMGSCVTINQPD